MTAGHWQVKGHVATVYVSFSRHASKRNCPHTHTHTHLLLSSPACRQSGLVWWEVDEKGKTIIKRVWIRRKTVSWTRKIDRHKKNGLFPMKSGARRRKVVVVQQKTRTSSAKDNDDNNSNSMLQQPEADEPIEPKEELIGKPDRSLLDTLGHSLLCGGWSEMVRRILRMGRDATFVKQKDKLVNWSWRRRSNEHRDRRAGDWKSNGKDETEPRQNTAGKKSQTNAKSTWWTQIFSNSSWPDKSFQVTPGSTTKRSPINQTIRWQSRRGQNDIPAWGWEIIIIISHLSEINKVQLMVNYDCCKAVSTRQ